MAISNLKIRRGVTGSNPEAPDKRETQLRYRSGFISDVQHPTAAGRYPECENVAMYVYDFAVDGGTHGSAITPVASVTLPANAIVTAAWMHVVTAVTSGGALTLSADLKSAGDLVAATAVGSLTLNAVITGAAQTTALRIAADTTPTVTVGAADATAGKVRVYLKYFYPDV